MELLQQKIGYTFKNISYLHEALTHSSYANEQHNPKIVLSIISAEYLFKKFPEYPEGKLSKLRSSLVCTQSLSSFANELSLGEYLYLGKGEAASGGAQRPTILENAFEALIAAIYLDGGMQPTKKFVLSFLSREVNNHHTNFKDYKTALQEIVQKNPDETFNYVLVGESGPDHDKRFEVEVHINSNAIAKGVGRSKKQAEQEAAKEALIMMGCIDG